MLDLCWHLRGSVPLSGAFCNAAVLDRVEELLARQSKNISERGSNYLVFNDPLWSSLFQPNVESSWPAMALYDRGRFWIEHNLDSQRLRYDLRSLHAMIFCLVAALMVFFFKLGGSGVSGSINYAIFAFVWLYGMNLVLAFTRVPKTVRSALAAG